MNERISQVWCRLSEAGLYEELKETLDQFGLQDSGKMTALLDKKGSFLLICGTLDKEPNFLAFLCQYVPKELLRQTLNNDNYDAVESFLLGHSGLEKRGEINSQRLSSRSQKFKLLMEIDPEGMKAYMESDCFKTRFTEGVKASFKQAVEEYRQDRLLIKY